MKLLPPRTQTGWRFFIGCLLPVAAVILVSCSKQHDQNSNQLATSSSPYLREHADNPVHWQEWNDETLAFAKDNNKPIIISIGYAACHWCHVMERESFMDTTIARIMNENFVCIKVDREERPDLDQVYIQAAELSSGNAGWPLNAFALPDGRPFYAATYFPKDYWSSLLTQVVTAFKSEPDNLEKQAKAIRANIQRRDSLDFGHISAEASFADDFLAGVPSWMSYLDLNNGGLSGNTKFPMPAVGEFFLQHNYLENHVLTQQWLGLTLTEMAYGGIYDQLGGGFARYATDSTWRVPHFEKMLYDNGQLVSLYAHAFQATGDSLYLRIVNETLNFVSAELTSPLGGFYSSINADSEGEEGKYYVWTDAEIRQTLEGSAAKAISTTFGISTDGNWERGKNILYIPVEHRNENKIRELTGARKLLLNARSLRIRPSTDEKILASWNAMMLNGYLDALRATGDEAYLKAALRNAEFIVKNFLADDNKIKHSFLESSNAIDGFLEDYAWTAKAFINLYQVTLDITWLSRAKELASAAIGEFGAPGNSLYFFTSPDQSNPISRKIEVYDNVIPSSNSVFAEVLFALGEYYQDEELTVKSKDALAQALQDDAAMGLYLANWARLAHTITESPFEIAVTGPDAVQYARELQRKYLPTAFFMGGDQENLPLLENKLQQSTIIYVCRNRVCKQPTTDVSEAARQIGFE